MEDDSEDDFMESRSGSLLKIRRRQTLGEGGNVVGVKRSISQSNENHGRKLSNVADEEVLNQHQFVEDGEKFSTKKRTPSQCPGDNPPNDVPEAGNLQSPSSKSGPLSEESGPVSEASDSVEGGSVSELELDDDEDKKKQCRPLSDDVPTSAETGPSSVSNCPICGKRFSSSFLEAHVNSCLDAREQMSKRPRKDEPSPKEECIPKKECITPSENEVEIPSMPSPSTQSKSRLDTSLADFLMHLGMAELLPKLLRSGYSSLSSLSLVRNEHLIKAGIDGVGRRKRILVELGALFEERQLFGVSDSAAPSQASGKVVANGKGSSNSKRIFPIFEMTAAENSKKQQETRKEFSLSAPKAGDHPFYKRVAGTTFTVDSFRVKPGSCRQFFLTHYHADHYGGLRKSFCAGAILCTELTAKMVQKQLGVSKDRLQILPLDEEKFIPDLGIGATRGKDNGAYVTLIDANHCPGACMFLFRVQSTGRTILHTGDCRFDEDLFRRNPTLAKYIGEESMRLDVMHLDTTYCNSKYTFPVQEQIVNAVLSFVRREAFNSRTLFLFGSYQLGKERLYLRVAEELNMTLYVEPYRARILLEQDLSDKVRSLVTTDSSQARIHVGPMSLASFRGASTRLRAHRSRFSNVIAVKPTGWTWSSSGAGITRQQRGNCILYSVAYSEHSSFPELRRFVQIFKPKRVIPTVGCRSAKDSRLMLEVLGHRDHM